jgi:hypothetical protein
MFPNHHEAKLRLHLTNMQSRDSNKPCMGSGKKKYMQSKGPDDLGSIK